MALLNAEIQSRKLEYSCFLWGSPVLPKVALRVTENVITAYIPGANPTIPAFITTIVVG
jgi:hypothetical protein